MESEKEYIKPDIVTSSVRNVEPLKEKDKVPVLKKDGSPEPGDVAVAKVVEEGGSYDEAELEGGEMVKLEEGDLIVGVLGVRKAVRGFASRIPEKLERGDPIDFVSSGGVMAECLSSPEELGKPYRLEFRGFVANDTGKVNISEYSIDLQDKLKVDCPVVLVASSRMDAGKTTLCAGLIEKFSERGKKVGAVKLTGVTRQRDNLSMKEAGAICSYEFTDCGLPSSTCSAEKAVKASKGLISEAAEGADIVVAELGAGLLSSYNVLEVLKDGEIKEACSSLIFMSIDPVGAYGGLRILKDHSYRPDVISGPTTDTDAGRENIRRFTEVPVLNGIHDIDKISQIIFEKVFS
ncbi:MAG: hypothetical protein ACLFQ8_00435 [Candidatus Aenigmatarchaeota archaeon]